ncbi:amidohydrolase(EC:) [Thermobrachium celere]|uniref:Peptidase M20 domain-containing protein 2 n=1 Tax=Thermobrachium celere DSM 8682 TaxID=941824 RepID=R7RP72_9CLOT|nr:amidohydrolase(EC:) [Thermobrachium celere]GFR36211.1 amidohydrolase [Thermobrachium celere]CDF57171.1 amidohydrolase(EC:) [Thermobrachium celere DSM 8682]
MSKTVIRELVTGYVENLKERIRSIVLELYKCSDAQKCEGIAYTSLVNLLKEEGFEVSDIPEIPNGFVAKYGSSAPNIAYLCEYDTVEGHGYINGHNIQCTMNVLGAIGLKRAINEIGGSCTVFGCPSEEKNPTKIKLLENNYFNNIDAALCAHPYTKTLESGSSLSMLISNMQFKGYSSSALVNFDKGINPITPAAVTISSIEAIKSKYKEHIYINYTITDCMDDICKVAEKSCVKILIKSDQDKLIDFAQDDILDIARLYSKIYRCDFEYSTLARYVPFKTHSELSKIFCHNLKEKGIVDIHGPMIMSQSLDMANLSYKIPCIHPYIGITQDNIEFYSKEFADATIKDFAIEQLVKTASALALTGIDIIENTKIISH